MGTSRMEYAGMRVNGAWNDSRVSRALLVSALDSRGMRGSGAA